MQIWLQFTDHGIEGVVPLELLPPDVRSKYQAKPNDKSKRAKKEEMKGAAPQLEENQVSFTTFTFAIFCFSAGMYYFSK
jgi:THO complex subunit 1